jgi:hypothetical protein
MKTAKCRSLWRAALICAPALALAQTFSFEIGSPVASQDFRFKTAAFVFRTAGCAESEKHEVDAKAEGIVEGARRSMPLKVVPSSKPGVYGVQKQWDTGRWVVILSGSCGNARAGAIVPVGPSGFVRDASKFFTHPPTAAEIEAALQSFPEGGNK